MIQLEVVTDLGSGRQVDEPVLGVAGRLGRADELVGAGSQEVSAHQVAKRPAARRVAALGDRDDELAARLSLLRLARHVAEAVDGQVLAQVRAQVDGSRLPAGRLQRPDLLLLQAGAVSVDLRTQSKSRREETVSSRTSYLL